MKKIMPKPKLLPIRVNLILPSKNGLKIENVHVKPYDNVNDLFKIVEDFQVARQDPVLTWTKENLKVQLTGPLFQEEQKQGEENHDIGELGEAKGSLSQNLIIFDWTQPFSTFNTMAGSTITFLGEDFVAFNSDKPLECMTLNYDKDPAATFNYFSCKTCNTNWVCESCRDGCHQGHQLLPHLMNHRPTWACCYCMKKDLCKIANKKRPKVGK
jgi:hypothetical protein